MPHASFNLMSAGQADPFMNGCVRLCFGQKRMTSPSYTRKNARLK